MRQLIANVKQAVTRKHVAIALGGALIAGSAVAGSGGNEFATAYGQIKDWMEGTLGKLMAVGALAVGLGMGVVKQSIMASVVGVSLALACAYGPGVLDGILTAALPIAG